MRIIKNGTRFSFSYTAFDQYASLFIAFSIYDVSTGVPIFVIKINGTLSAFGTYDATYLSNTSKTFLIIGLSYTDGSYSVIDTARGASSECIKVYDLNISLFAFEYGTYDQASGLFIQSSVYDLSSGSPVFVSSSPLVEVIGGVYFGSFTGIENKTYQIISTVYTDGTYLTVDYTQSPACESFDCVLLPLIIVIENVMTEAVIVGQSTQATLTEAQC